jgi:hypothetical protein
MEDTELDGGDKKRHGDVSALMEVDTNTALWPPLIDLMKHNHKSLLFCDVL